MPTVGPRTPDAGPAGFLTSDHPVSRGPTHWIDQPRSTRCRTTPRSNRAVPSSALPHNARGRRRTPNTARPARGAWRPAGGRPSWSWWTERSRSMRCASPWSGCRRSSGTADWSWTPTPRSSTGWHSRRTSRTPSSRPGTVPWPTISTSSAWTAAGWSPAAARPPLPIRTGPRPGPGPITSPSWEPRITPTAPSGI
ncbi:hypothetical protein ACFFX0_11700 [Citricoccus parietis]|uniref:Uncharacterized protein n=1 Tax=Citricoccus parietis TaxID=592307 RepID=A0ABV5FYT1_9MICC